MYLCEKADELYLYDGGVLAYTIFCGCKVSVVFNNNLIYIGDL